VQLLQHRLAVVEIAQRVRQQDEVERTFDLPLQAIQRFDVTDAELQFRIGMLWEVGARHIGHVVGEIDPQTEGWFQFGKQRSRAAAEIQNARTLGNQEPHERGIIRIEAGILVAPLVAFRCDPIDVL